MTKKIFYSIFVVALAVLLACLVIILGVLFDYVSSMQNKQLNVQTNIVAQGLRNEGLFFFDGLDNGDYRITWIADDGTVLYDTDKDASIMENHLQREEIQEALTTGRGESQRYSATFSEKTLYSAQRLPDGTVLRVSLTQHTTLILMLGMLQPVFFVLILAIILSLWLANRLAKRIVEPLNTLNLDEPLENENAYEEISPLLTQIEKQHRQINSQINALKRQQDEFSAVTGNMSEGLILLNEQGKILSINLAAAQLFNADSSCIGQDIMTIERSIPMQQLIHTTLSGKHDEALMEVKGRQYQINASPIVSDDKVSGVVILAFDITEKALSEQKRREFSANVSHELKTPLHSIMGSAELIENGLIKEDDMPRFIGHIRSEASRLVALIEDIIRLSQLDENGEELTREEVNLLALAQEAKKALHTQATEHNISVKVQGMDISIYSVRRLLYEIIYNLCDNAIKYNRDNGQVNIFVTQNDTETILSFQDTGIGIPEEHQSRVFERFYRVDKSHSKETGGTGLGLSIVKHAAIYLNAEIDLQSQVGQGTTIRIHFPK